MLRASSSQRFSSPNLVFARDLERVMIRSVIVAPGAMPTTRTPLSVDLPPSAAVKAISAALPEAPQI